jgi:hypothetical protein
MAEHYQESLIDKKWEIAKDLLEKKGGAEAKTGVGAPLGDKNIVGSAKKRHSNFFNFCENLFLGDRFRNSAIGRALDPEKPGMGKKALAEHVANIKKTWAMGPFTPTPLEDA